MLFVHCKTCINIGFFCATLGIVPSFRCRWVLWLDSWRPGDTGCALRGPWCTLEHTCPTKYILSMMSITWTNTAQWKSDWYCWVNEFGISHLESMKNEVASLSFAVNIWLFEILTVTSVIVWKIQQKQIFMVEEIMLSRSFI